MRRRKIYSLSNRGFSLLEILIALALLVSAGAYVGIEVFSSLQDGKRDVTISRMNGLSGSLEEFRRKCGKYPAQLEELLSPPGDCRGAPSDGFLKGGELPLDAWDGDFEYTIEGNGRKYVIQSYGNDRDVGGADHDADVCSYSGKIKSPCNEEGEPEK